MRTEDKAFETVKKQLIKELKIQQHAYFESKLAEYGLTEVSYESVYQVSQVIHDYLVQHKDKVIDLIKTNQKITDELREPFFGHLYQKKEKVTAETVFTDFIQVMKKPSGALATAMQMHCIFEYRLFDNIEFDAHKRLVKKEMLETLKPTSLFAPNVRGRLDTVRPASETKKMGIVKNPVLAKKISDRKESHLRAVDRFMPDESALFVVEAEQHGMPIVAGRSGHTASLLSGAKTYGELNTEQATEYAWACFVFLAAGGNHSFHEVMSIAALAGVPYQTGNYVSAIPASLKTTGFFGKMLMEFPQYLDAANSGLFLKQA